MILEIDNWHTVASEYERKQEGKYRIIDHVYKAGFYPYYYMDGYVFFQFKKDEVLTLLQEQRDGIWCDWMIDSPMDVRAMEKYAEYAKGDVLCAGLGLGIIAHELVKRNKSVTVVERSPEVIELTGRYLPKGVNLVQGDFWEFVKNDTNKWGMIIVDIWATKGKEQHDWVFREEVFPSNDYLRKKYPETAIVFHGFANVTDVPLVEPAFKRKNEN